MRGGGGGGGFRRSMGCSRLVYRSPLIWLYGLELGYNVISTLTLQAVDKSFQARNPFSIAFEFPTP